MFSTLILLVAVYFEYTYIKSLIEFAQTGQPFATEQWLTLGMTVLFLPVIVFSVFRVLKDNKKNKEKREEEQKKLAEEQAKRRHDIYHADDELDEFGLELETNDQAFDMDTDVTSGALVVEETAAQDAELAAVTDADVKSKKKKKKATDSAAAESVPEPVDNPDSSNSEFNPYDD